MDFLQNSQAERFLPFDLLDIISYRFFRVKCLFGKIAVVLKKMHVEYTQIAKNKQTVNLPAALFHLPYIWYDESRKEIFFSHTRLSIRRPVL